MCVRCDGPLVPPDGSDRWTCVHHGSRRAAAPAAVPAEPHHLADTASSSGVPVWLPLAAAARLGRGRGTPYRRHGHGARVVVVASPAPGVTARQAEMLVVAEEPGVGLGAAYAGLDSNDPGPELAALPRRHRR